MPAHVDTFAINRNLHFMQVSELVGVPLDLLRDMNPQYIHDVIPGNEGASILRLPSQFTTAFIDHEDSVYTYRQKELFSPATLENLRNAGTSSTQLTYVVKKGDYLGKIAARNGVSVSQIKQWNNLRSNNLRIGQRLVIYKGGAPKATAVASTAKTSSSASASSGQSGYTTYTVRKGDTLYKIASRYPGVSSNDIMKYNGISSSIKAGQKIKIPQK